MSRSRSIVPEEVLGELSDSLRAYSNESDLPQPSISSESSPLQRSVYQSALEESGRQLISLLPVSIRDYMIELANITLKIPVWQLLLGSVMAQYESGNLAAPSIDPSWRQAELITGESTCHYHKCPLPERKFTPKRIGQLFCSNSCGDGDRLEKRDLRRGQVEEKRLNV